MAYIKQNWSEMQAKEIPVEAKHFEHIEESLADVINKVGDVVTTEVATWHDSVFELGEATHLMTAVDKLPLEENKPYTIILTDENDEEFTYELTLVDSEAVNGITGYKMLYFGDLLLDLDKDVGFALIQDGVAVDENCTIKSAPHKAGVLLIGYKKAVVKGTHATKSLQKVIVQDEEYAKALQNKIDNGIKKAYRGQVDALHKHLEDQINKLDAETSEKLEEANNRLDELEDKVEQHRETTNTQITDLNTQVIEIIEMLDNTEVENLKELHDKVDRIDETVTGHITQLSEINSKLTAHDTQFDEVNASIADLQNQIDNVKIEGYDELVEQVSIHETRIETLKANATNIENQINDHTTHLTDIDVQLSEKESQISLLTEQLSDTNEHVATLIEENTQINAKIEEINSQTEALAGRITVSEEQLDTQATQLTETNTRIDNSNAQIETIQSTYAKLSEVDTKDTNILTEAKAYVDEKIATSSSKVQIITWEEQD